MFKKQERSAKDRKTTAFYNKHVLNIQAWIFLKQININKIVPRAIKGSNKSTRIRLALIYYAVHTSKLQALSRTNAFECPFLCSLSYIRMQQTLILSSLQLNFSPSGTRFVNSNTLWDLIIFLTEAPHLLRFCAKFSTFSNLGLFQQFLFMMPLSVMH